MQRIRLADEQGWLDRSTLLPDIGITALKVVYLAIEAVSKKWTMPIQNWKKALNRFAIEFEERMPNL